MEYRKSAHTVLDIKYHAVWITKYRYKVLRRRVASGHAIWSARSARRGKWWFMRGGASPDHIHLLLSAPAKLVQYIKGRSLRRQQEEFPELRKRYRGQHLWARGNSCATVGAVDEKTIRASIESQKWDTDDQGFRIVAPGEP